MGLREPFAATLAAATLVALSWIGVVEAGEGSTIADPVGQTDGQGSPPAAGVAEDAEPQTGPDALVYTPPPDMDNPDARIVGTTRESRVVLLLAPNHVAWTSVASPSLHYFFTRPVNDDVEILLVVTEERNGALDLTLHPPFEAGLHRVALTDLGVELDRDRLYHWSVSVVVERDRRWLDDVAVGAVRWTVPDEALKQRLVAADLTGRAALFGENGYWYDMVDTLVALIDRSPDDDRWPALTRALLIDAQAASADELVNLQ